MLTKDDVFELPHDITDLVCVLAAECLAPEYQHPKFQLFKVTGGSCARRKAPGEVEGIHLVDGEECGYNRAGLIGFVMQKQADKILKEE